MLNSAKSYIQVFIDQNGVAEGAIDAGGPTRELLRLAMKDAAKLPIFYVNNKGTVALCRNSLGTY